MNQFVILFAIVVGFTYFGGTNVPKMLKDNQQVLLGVLVGLMIGQMNLVEGVVPDPPVGLSDEQCDAKCLATHICTGYKCEGCSVAKA